MSIASTLLTGRLLGPHSDHKVFLVGISSESLAAADALGRS